MGPDNAIWDDGEWVGWGEIEQQIQYKEWDAKYPNAGQSQIPIFKNLLSVAEQYNKAISSNLQAYGEIGELFGAITFGLKQNRNCGGLPGRR